ncbi:endonuclease/exonuclease/phosphatase family protein [Deinococcus sp. VB142]|uniref:Endonuclease/exonuclease/phosphatase family protein n=1 Tax=Deinococcus sp. VB142 TaxID=3112952 RepID=A0AAU6PZ82_9DEIO
MWPLSRPLHSRLAWLSLGVVALAWALGEWVAERTPLTLLLAYVPPLVWLFPALLALVWTLYGRLRGRRRGVGLALLALGLALRGAGLLHWRPQGDGELRVLTYNVARGTLGRPEQILKTLKAADADVILLQETNFIPAGYGDRLRRGLAGYDLRRGHEVWTLSRLPVVGERQILLPGSRRVLLETELRRPDGTRLTVINAHLHTVLVSSALRGRWDEVRTTARARTWEVAELCRLATEAAGPVLLGGDLNTPPRGLLYRRLTRCIGPDAHDVVGRGPAWTFPSLYLRIDHQMARGLTPRHAEVRPTPGSDHLPLLVGYH